MRDFTSFAVKYWISAYAEMLKGNAEMLKGNAEMLKGSVGMLKGSVGMLRGIVDSFTQKSIPVKTGIHISALISAYLRLKKFNYKKTGSLEEEQSFL